MASKVIAILMTFTDDTTLSLTEIAHRTGLPISTTHRLATELAAWGMLERTEDGTFWVGSRLRMIGTRARHAPSMQELARRVLEDLSAATGTDVRLGILMDLDVAYIERPHSGQPVSTFSTSSTLPAHASALGKVLLAFATASTLDRVIARGLEAYTPYTLTSPEQLRRALGGVRVSRVAVSRWELDVGVSSVAAPVFGSGGHVVAALELRVRDLSTDLSAMRPALTVAARGLSRQLATRSDIGRCGVTDTRRNGHAPNPNGISYGAPRWSGLVRGRHEAGGAP